jgi:hypothetical protein
VRRAGCSWFCYGLKPLRDKALAETADDPVARQRFLYWTWTFDAFLKEAEEIAQKKKTR